MEPTQKIIHSSKSSPSLGRSSNLELYRIIVMLLIIAHHYVVNSGLTSPIYTNLLSKRSLFLLIFGMWGKTGINCFVLITGYFMCKSRITVKKFAKLLLESYFYCFSIHIIFLLTGYTPFSLREFVMLFLPFTSISDGFTSCFLVFYLMIPFLTILVQNMTERQHFSLIMLCGTVFTLLGTLPFFEIRFNYVTWFAVLFIIASYIRLYPKPWMEDTRLLGMLTAVSVILSVLSVVAQCWYNAATGNSKHPYAFVADSNKLFAVTTAVFSFLFFKSLKIRDSKWINTIASSTFGVLLIHANSDTMRQWLWQDTCNNVGFYSSPYLIIHAAGVVLLVFAVCTAIDQLRILFLERPLFRWLERFAWFQ